jgi:DNA-binding MarR family transcriptional regulator
MRAMKTTKQLERYMKGAANHRRIEILMLLAKEDGMGVEEIAERLRCNMKTISVHLQRLAGSGLVEKKYHEQVVRHSLSTHGKAVHKFLQTL